MKTVLNSGTIARWLLLAIAFLLPWHTRYIFVQGSLEGAQWEYGTVSLYGLDILVVFAIIFGIGFHITENTAARIRPVHITAIALLILAATSLLYAGNKTNAVFWFFKLAEGIGLLAIIPGLGLQHKIIAWAFGTAAILQSILAYIQFSLQHVWGNKWLGMAEQLPSTLGVTVIDAPIGRVLRSYGSLPHPNMLAGFLLIGLIAVVFIYLHSTHLIERIIGSAALTLIATGIWLTFSRQALIALTIVMIILTAVSFLTTRTFPARVFAAILYILLPLITLSLLFQPLIATRTTSNSALEQRSLNERSEQIYEASTLLQTHWVTGVGLGNYTAELHAIDANNNAAQPAYTYQPVHNIYLLLFTELGIVGLLLFFGTIAVAIRSTLFESPWSLAWGLGVLSLLLIGFIDHYLWSMHFGILFFWFILGLFIDKKRAIH